jgi:hypothetical protein
MPTFELTDDEIATLHDAFHDVGSDCPSIDWDKFKALGVKFGFWEAEKPLTAEELKRQEEFRASPYAKQMKALFAASNAEIDKLAVSFMADNVFFSNPQWTVGSELRIKMPNDYQVNRIKK